MEYEYCTPKQIQDFFAEFGATDETVRRDVQYLIQWIEQSQHLPDVKDVDLLENILLRAKNNVEKAKKLIDRYYTARAKMPEIFRDRGLEFSAEIEDVRKYVIICPFPKLTPNGQRIILFGKQNANFSAGWDHVPNTLSVLKYSQIINDIGLKFDKVRGFILIYDYGGMDLETVKQMIVLGSPKKSMILQNYVTPIRYSKIYVVNVPSIATTIVNLTLSFVKKEKRKDVVLWTKKATDLVEVIPKNCLPSEYGGSLPNIAKLEEIFFCEYEKCSNWVKTQENIQANLKLKPADSNQEETSEYGVNGTFRQLKFD